MRKQLQKCAYLAVAALLCFAGGAYAQICPSTLTCEAATYNGTGSNGLGTVTVGGDTLTVISTDYADTASIGSYSGIVQTVGGLDTAIPGTTSYNYNYTMWGAAITATQVGSTDPATYFYAIASNDPVVGYEFAAYIASEMLGCATAPTPSCYSQSDYQNAIYYLMDPPGESSLYGNDNTNAAAIADDAFFAVYGYSENGMNYAPTVSLSTYSDVELITPGYSVVDPACSPGNPTSQTGCGEPEFLAFATPPVVSTPETSEPLLLGADLLGLLGIAFMFRRRLVRVKR